MNEEELREFMGEMREFKRQTLERLSSIEGKLGLCQTEPAVCATARLVEGHLKTHQRDGTRRISIAAACIAGITCAANLIGQLARRG
jgi:hypothetical protein